MTVSLPPALIRSLTRFEHFNPESFQHIHEIGEGLSSVHMNPQKSILGQAGWSGEIRIPPFEVAASVPWAPDAYYLKNRPSFTLDPLFHAGNYYVQEASGMFLAFALKTTTDLSQKLKVLDLCAAPGGKSTLIQSLIRADSLLVSNEVIKSRIPVLCQNMTKWGYANGMVTHNDPVHFKKLSGYFDILLIDAPCSGSGLFRKNKEAIGEWSEDLVSLCSQRQQRILADAWECLKEEGLLFYTTCSYSREENEDILDQVMQNYAVRSVSLSPDPAWNIVETLSDRHHAYGYRFYPDKLDGEGFFLAVLQKKQITTSLPARKINRNSTELSKVVTARINHLIKPGDRVCKMVGEAIHALPAALEGDFEMLRSHLYLKKAGIRLGKPGENEWIPDPELALAGYLKKDTDCMELNISDALRFLRGESFEVPAGERGWRVVRYQGQEMGWIKLLGNRLNNYYPKAWRIRH